MGVHTHMHNVTESQTTATGEEVEHILCAAFLHWALNEIKSNSSNELIFNSQRSGLKCTNSRAENEAGGDSSLSESTERLLPRPAEEQEAPSAWPCPLCAAAGNILFQCSSWIVSELPNPCVWTSRSHKHPCFFPFREATAAQIQRASDTWIWQALIFSFSAEFPSLFVHLGFLIACSPLIVHLSLFCVFGSHYLHRLSC